MYEKLSAAAQYIQSVQQFTPRVGIVLGSGLGAFVKKVQGPLNIPYCDIPFFHETTVEGHQGRLILGCINSVPLAILQGRLHAYEGREMEEVVFPVRTLATLGVETIILTNAAGGIKQTFSPGDLVLINDHINLTGRNPLVGPNINKLGPRFPDMTQAYHPQLKAFFRQTAEKSNIPLKEGVYCSLLGPTFETPAEVKMLAHLGADMVGMSTVPEAIAANHLGLKVAGISCITNMAAGISNTKLSHDDVKERAQEVMEKFSNLLAKTIERITSND